MVRNVISLTGSGLADFVIQRVTAVVVGLYVMCVAGFLATHSDIDYAQLVHYFGSPAMKVFSTLAVLSTAAHAWIGMWTVGTDYIRPHYFGGAATIARAVYHAVWIFLVFVYVIWALVMFWRI